MRDLVMTDLLIVMGKEDRERHLRTARMVRRES